MIYKIDVKSSAVSKYRYSFDAKIVYDQAAAVRYVIRSKEDYPDADVSVTILEEVSTVGADAFLSEIKRDAYLTDLLGGGSEMDFRSMVVEKIGGTSVLVQDVSGHSMHTSLKQYIDRFYREVWSSVGKEPSRADMTKYVVDRMLSSLSVTNLSDAAAKKKFLAKWKNELLGLCSDPEWYDVLLSVSGWRSFPKVEGHGSGFIYSSMGPRINLSGKEVSEFAAALVRKKAKGKTNKA